MKKATLTVSFDCEKLDALTFHMGKKDADLQTELEDTVQEHTLSQDKAFTFTIDKGNQ